LRFFWPCGSSGLAVLLALRFFWPDLAELNGPAAEQVDLAMSGVPPIVGPRRPAFEFGIGGG